MKIKVSENLIHWVYLTLVFGTANPRKWIATSNYKSVKEFYKLSLSGKFLKSMTSDEIKSAKSTTIDMVKDLLITCKKNGISICTYDDESYPNELKTIANPPSILFYKGDIDFINHSIILAVAGARELSQYSEQIEREILGRLLDNDFKFVSGFQTGADVNANLISLERNVQSITVLPCGFLEDYPKNTRSIREDISNNGVVISEYLPNEKANAKNFIARNRLIAGISLGALIVEAKSNSGSLSIASYALGQGKDIFTFPPHDILDERYKGQIELFRDGAIPVMNERDIINEYKSSYSHRLTFTQEEVTYVKREKKTARKRKPKEKTENIENITNGKNDKPEINLDNFSDIEQKVLTVIINGTEYIEDIRVSLSLDTDELLSVITDLELQGIIKSKPGKRYTL